MKRTLILALTTALMTTTILGLRAQAQASGRTATVSLITKALADAKGQAADDQLVTLQAAAKAVMAACPNNLLISRKLQAVLHRSEANGKKQVKSLQAALSESAEILNFRVKRESDLPEGFPEPAGLGEIQLKHYPAYRLARTTSQRNSAFFTLFNHIKSNKIEMTAPVEMRYDEVGQRYEQIDMAFLYGASDWGRLGEAGNGVTVEDMPAMSTVAIGLTGNFDPNDGTYTESLASWLAQHAPEYERDGKVRVMGYNSPFVWKSQRFFEIEIPVKKRSRTTEVAAP